MPHSGDFRREKPVRSGTRDPAVTSSEAIVAPSFAASTAREAAFQVLEQVRQTTTRVSEAWVRVQSTAALNPLDRNLSRELAFGVVRREITLDVVLQSLMKRPLSEIEPPLKTVLQLGVYQLLFADQIPPHAAVHETVELAKKVGRLRWAGFVNGILRAASRLCTEDVTDAPSTNALPVGDATKPGSSSNRVSLSEQIPVNKAEPGFEPASPRFRLLTEPVFPDPQTNFLGYFWRAYGFPEWLAARWVMRWPPEVLHRLGIWQRMPPPVFLRVNRLRTAREELLQRLHQADIEAAPAALPEAIEVHSGGRIEDWPGYAEGWFSVQDLTAMHAAIRLSPTPGSRVLDLCAAPGGKSCHLAELMDDAGEVLALDITPQRLSRIVENAARLQLKSVHALLVNEDGSDLPQGPFDFILADVPCSNTGVIGRRPEVPRQLTPAAIEPLSELQFELLNRAVDRLKPGGRILYSTCSIEAEENERVVQRFLQQHAEVRIVEEVLSLPGSPADGGYQALLVIDGQKGNLTAETQRSLRKPI